MNTAISIKNVSKKYVIAKQKDGSLRGTLAGMFSRRQSNTEEFLALNDVSFDIQQGDVVGIIGKNGAGKSTLLKILSQITKPSTGSIEINGRVASLLEVGTGFHPELTGRENVYLNGTILGMTRKEVKAKFDEIVAFSGVEKFIDTPVKHYSSGMYVRLAFAVAAHLEPEILIIDEVLAVGDAEFQKKCLGKMGEVAGEGRTVLFVSHNLVAVKNLCNKGILFKNGSKIFEGNIEDTISEYSSLRSEKKLDFDTSNFKERSRGPRFAYIENISLNDVVFCPESKFQIRIKVNNQHNFEAKELQLMVLFFDEMSNIVYQLSSNFLYEVVNFDKNIHYTFEIEKLKLSQGYYSLGVWLGVNGFEQDYIDEIVGFEVEYGSSYAYKNQPIISQVQTDFNFYWSK